MSKVVARFAPSPTGYLHIGGARTALFNWLLARGSGGRFLLRIEDTDVERSSQEMTQAILDSMHWLGLDYDQEPYYQSKRFEVYKEYIQKLVRTGHAYYCRCTPEEVEEMREKARALGQKPKYSGKCREACLQPGPDTVIRLKAPQAGQTVYQDQVKGSIAVDNTQLDDLVLERMDGTPTYNLAVVADDIEMGITHVLRGDDHINNTPRQLLIYQALDVTPPFFGHVPMILGPDKKKLSKRHGALSVMAYKEMGYLPEALVNYLARLGWSYKDEEIFSLEDLLQKFSLDNLGASACVFDTEKLKWLNSHYIKESSPARLALILQQHLDASQPVPAQAYLENIIPLLQPRASTMQEMAEMAHFFLVPDQELEMDQKAVDKFLTPEAREYLREIAEILAGMEEFDQENLEQAMKVYIEEKNIKFKAIAQPLRVALTGKTASPGIFETMQVLGRESCVNRLRRVQGI
ncbi:glutamyl-tRNA synthetase [Desulfonatronospira thiodismutans ASO3-1]|uniref:Glutamate--tRNA ligase n=1 Tax=Desulfonatronospira thiodismutans ASO3-1 TaxID=555779 RepID=D6SM71_9BACT|nr:MULTISPECIES: glutamate--tRNA ligase [Desulfonatronospira]EFI35782.1 glutamyl-tRNA synthetase [Desulfonatronospira thiodismutans ASO3-1]RQD77352.1 MAG: glutamate--tRNA ligase [Desulfonatronospira sp. MSAO_Bac3]